MTAPLPSFVVTPEGKRKAVKPANRVWTLEELYKLIDTDIVEVVYATKDSNFILIIDEEGKLKNKETNIAATNLTNLYPFDVIVGNALYTPSSLLE